MALNWSKALQTAGGGIKEGGMLIGGMMYDTEQKREARLAATQAATLEGAQGAYLETYKSAYSAYKTLLGHRWKPVTGGTVGADSELQQLMGEGAVDWTDLDAAIDRAWGDVETARRDYYRAVGIEYKKKSKPELPDVDKKGPLGFTIAEQVQMGMADFEGKVSTIQKGAGIPGWVLGQEGQATGIRGGDKSTLTGSIARINQARIAKARTMVGGELTEADEEAAKLSGKELLAVEQGLKQAIISQDKSNWPDRYYRSDRNVGLAQALRDEEAKVSEADAALQEAGMDTGVYDLTVPDPALVPGLEQGLQFDALDAPEDFVPGAADKSVAADENWAIQNAQQGTQGMISQVASYDEAWGQFASILQALLAEFGPDVAMQRYTEITGGVPPGSEAARAAQEVLAQFQRQGIQGIQ